MLLQLLVGGVVLLVASWLLRCSRRRADAAQRLQAATLSSIGDAVIATDTAGAVTFMNPEAQRLTGWLGADALDRPLAEVFQVVQEDTGADAENAVATVLRTGEQQALSNHMVLVTRDGTRTPIETKASPIREANREIDGVVLIFRDCTRARQVEAAMRERMLLQEQLSQIASTAPGVICAYRAKPDGSTTYPYASPGIKDIYGISPEELARDASRAFNVIHSDDVRWVAESTSESARLLEAWQGEFRVNHPVKGLIWVEGRFIPEREPDGSVLWRGFLTDITTRKRAEEALHLSEERFREIAENIREVFWLTDPAKGTIMYVSPGYEAIWGRSTASLYVSPRQWMEAIHPDDRERVVTASITQQRTGEYDEEYRIIRPDGSERWIRDRAFPVRDATGRVIRIAGVAEDITERHQLESELRQAQKMESVGLLAGGVAHDFNNALTVIMGATETLAESMPPDVEQGAMLDEIRKATERAASLTRQLLAFSRKDVVEPRVIDFNALVTETERMLRRLLGEDIELSATLTPGVAFVRVDPGQWDQVLMNLAVNARDAMTGCGRLAIATREMSIDEHSDWGSRGVKPGRYVELTVSDTGSGITPEILPRIFEPFFTTKGIGHGTGLGLAVVYGIVRQNGGGIEVSSTIGVGTTFTILIPTVATEVDTRTVSRDAAQVGVDGCETILLVEDEDSLRRMAARTLAKHGYAVLQAGNGVDALRVLDRHAGPVDLLITDVVMPGMDGRELAEHVREQQPLIRVLFTSGYTEDAIVRRGVEAESMSFLQKPYRPAALAKKAREVCDGQVLPRESFGLAVAG